MLAPAQPDSDRASDGERSVGGSSAWGSDTDCSSRSVCSDLGEPLDFLSAVDDSGDFASADFDAVQLAGHAPPSPRMREIYDTLNIAVDPSVLSVAHAVGMPQLQLGDRTESVRRWARRMVALQQPEPAARPTAGPACDNQCLVLAPACTGVRGRTPAAGASHATPLAAASAVVVQQAATAAASMAGQLQANLAGEERAMRAAARALVEAIPPILLFRGTSHVPMHERVANKVDHVSSCGLPSLKRATYTIKAWREFCVAHDIPQWGAECCDVDLVQWFAREGRPRGRTVPHERMEGLRWLASNMSCPFQAASSVEARKFAPPSTAAEPKWAEMWRVAEVVHLLRIAVMYAGPRA